MRQLKFHEQKLLKKVDFFQWKSVDNQRRSQVISKYNITNSEDYHRYNILRGFITKLANELSLLSPDDPFRKEMTDKLLTKLVEMGLLVNKGDLNKCSEISVSSFCRRRLSSILRKLNMAENTKEAVTFIEQGQIRVGQNVVSDPAYFVPKCMEDYVTWVDSSKIKRTIMSHDGTLDDFELMMN